jgi:hypothetical protein
MTKNGSIVIKYGKRSIFKSGSVAVFNSKENCSECCCSPKLLGSFTTNSSKPIWNLTQYQGNGIAAPGSLWRLRESGSGLIYGSGTVDSNGELVSLPNSFTTSSFYDGYMRLEIGCPQPNGTIKWP